MDSFPTRFPSFFLQFSVHLISKLLQNTIFLVFQSYLYLCKQVQDLVLQISNSVPGDSVFGFRVPWRSSALAIIGVLWCFLAFTDIPWRSLAFLNVPWY